jgi:2-dehydropantoate 2-reductase
VVVGAGAVGSFYGAMLARAGHRVTLIGRAPHVQAILRDGLQLHMGGQVHAVPLAATTELDAVRDADLVLFCVKSTDTDAVARRSRRCWPPTRWCSACRTASTTRDAGAP